MINGHGDATEAMWQMAARAWLSVLIFTLGCDIRLEAKNKLLIGLI